MNLQISVDINAKNLISALMEVLCGLLDDEEIDENTRNYCQDMVIALTKISEYLD
ncbi:MAG: hypothetical protein GX947_02460 [Tissierellia bacterium]|nr:hypothetical protein [Tissierellia bacterium]